MKVLENENFFLKEKIINLEKRLKEAEEVIEFYENTLGHAHGGSDFIGDHPSSNRADLYLKKYKRGKRENE